MKKLKTYKEINKRYLFLDDIRYPYLINNNSDSDAYNYTKFKLFKEKKWDIVRNYIEFTNYIELNESEDIFISFDHDLGEEKTGYDCAKWLCNYCLDNDLKFPDYYIHSGNTVGARNIKGYIDNYIKNIENA